MVLRFVAGCCGLLLFVVVCCEGGSLQVVSFFWTGVRARGYGLVRMGSLRMLVVAWCCLLALLWFVVVCSSLLWCYGLLRVVVVCCLLAVV